MLDGDLASWPTGSTAAATRWRGSCSCPSTGRRSRRWTWPTVPTDGGTHDLSVYMQDTGWPDAPLDDYIELWDHDYWQIMRQTPPDKKLLDIQACFQVAHGSGIRPEAILMQKVMNFPTLGRLLTGRGARPHHLARHLHGQGPGGPRPVGVQAAAHQRLVAALVTFPFTRHELVDAACLATGLDDFGEPSWAEGLDRLLEDLERNADLNELGMTIVQTEFTAYLSNRLRILDWRAGHPEVARAR